jgi:HAE1 family hydrophobic/amphiphilic exporter-1
MKFDLPDIALKRPVSMVMLSLTVVGMGVIAAAMIPVEFLPKIDVPFIGCYIPYIGATPAQVEQEVAIPAEEQFRTIPQIKRISTTSDGNGCSVRIEFDWSANMDEATAEVRDRMERLKLDLPSEIDRIMLRRFSSDSMPIMALSLYSDKNEEELAHLIQTVLQPRLMRIEGVAEVMIFSRADKQVLIEFSQDQLRARNVAMYDVISRLQTSSLNMPIGELIEGNNKHFVRVMGEFHNPREIGELVVGPNSLRLRDIANVSYNSREEEMQYSIDKKSGAFVLVRKEAEANAIETCEAVKAEIEKAKLDPLFEGMGSYTFFDQSKEIQSALNSLKNAGKHGGILSIAVLFLFLLRIRPTLIVAFAIPVSLLCALAYMYFTGMTLNIVTMISMIIGIGMLVDNSIVVIENIYRYQQLGYDAKTSALRGTSEVGLAITMATLTSIVVFVPTLYMQSGEMAVHMIQFAIPMSVSLIASLVVALTLIPLAASRMKPREEMRFYKFFARLRHRPSASAPENSTGNTSWFRLVHPFEHLKSGYARSLGFVVRHPLESCVFLALLVAVTFWLPAKQVKMKPMPTIDTRAIDIEVMLDQNFDLESAKKVFDLIEAELDRYRTELDIKNVWRHVEPNGGEITAYLKQTQDLAPGEKYRYSSADVLNILIEKLPQRMPGVQMRFSVPDGSEGQSQTITFWMKGDDAAQLELHAERLKSLIEAQIPGLYDVDVGDRREKQEVQIKIDDPLAERAGVSPFLLARTVDFALRGIRLQDIKQAGREIPVWAQFKEEDRKSKANLENVAIFTTNSGLMPLNDLVDQVRAKSPQAITRVDSKNVIMLTAKTTTDDLLGVSEQLRTLLRRFDLPRGYSVSLGDEIMDMNESIASFVMAMVLAAVLIYVVMAALFESLLLPLSIMTSLPIAGIGVVWAMYLTNTAMDQIALIGAILLIGIVVNNKIVLIDHINQLRKRGMDRYPAIIQGGRDRIRPVLMTALTTILGCVPLALGGELGGNVSFASLGRALIGGLLTGSFLTLYVVPLFYSLIDDFSIWLRCFFGDLLSIGTLGAKPEEDPVGK